MCNGKCGGMCVPMMICKILLIIGGLNWGLVGVGMLMGSNWNVVNMIFGSMPTLEAIIYILVGLAAIMKMVGCRCKKCMGGAMMDKGAMGGMDKQM
jgi:hypothetical protein